jgi:hypothetical protein
MNRTLILVLAVALAAGAGHGTRAAQEFEGAAAGRPELNESERELVRGSRAAIIGAGFSAPYFDRHFELFRVLDRAGDRRVVWRFRAGGHEAYVEDSVGSYTDERGGRRHTHSAAATLGAAHDIRPAVSRRRAERLMRSCIGQFEGGAVALQPFGPAGRTALVFTAASVPREPPRRGGRPTVYLAAVNLETGRCLKGKAQAGRPRR